MPNVIQRRRFARSLAMGLWASLILGLGCGGEAEPPGHAYPDAVRWTGVPESATYRVQVWSGLRLVFEESASETTLALNGSMLRALASFDSVDVQIRAMGPSGVLGIERFTLRPVRAGER